MKKLVAAALALALLPATARAWEPQTTQQGLAEQAALASKLHKRLASLGFSGGLFEPLTIPPADAPALMAALRLLSPTHGAVPDGRGRQAALAWLAAGAALADVPAKHGANHFYDPKAKLGWTRPDRALFTGLADRVRESLGRSELPDKGVPAPDWVVAKGNPFNLEEFEHQYERAVSASTPGERSRHMAAALVAAGAMMHVLGDVGVPSRVRGDYAAHLDQLGGGPDDLGSRFEHIAALSYGRLGVPAPDRVIARDRLRDFFTASDGRGLADLIARSYFSEHTLPEHGRSDAKPQLARPLPALPTRLNLMAASRDDGTTLRDAKGTCLARYKVEHNILSFWLDDDCELEEIAQILPAVAAYETGLLDYLLRGELILSIGETITVAGKNLGAGTVDILVEDERGVRTPIGRAQTQGGRELLGAVVAPPSGRRIVAVFHGTDARGEPLVAVGAMPLTRP